MSPMLPAHSATAHSRHSPRHQLLVVDDWAFALLWQVCDLVRHLIGNAHLDCEVACPRCGAPSDRAALGIVRRHATTHRHRVCRNLACAYHSDCVDALAVEKDPVTFAIDGYATWRPSQLVVPPDTSALDEAAQRLRVVLDVATQRLRAVHAALSLAAGAPPGDSKQREHACRIVER